MVQDVNYAGHLCEQEMQCKQKEEHIHNAAKTIISVCPISKELVTSKEPWQKPNAPPKDVEEVLQLRTNLRNRLRKTLVSSTCPRTNVVENPNLKEGR